VAAVSSDRLFPVPLNQEISDGIPGSGELRVIDSPYGHDGFLIEVDAVAKIVTELLGESRPSVC
jgi:homoserine O-acetyltransferase